MVNLILNKIAIFTCLFLPFLLWPSYCFALPTPETLIVSLQVFPAIFAIFTGFIMSIGLRFRSWLEKTQDQIQFLMRAGAVLSIALFFSVIFLFISINSNNKNEKIGNIAQYFLSDTQLDENELVARDEERLWFASGSIKEVFLTDLEQITSLDEQIIFISTPRLRITHDSAIPTLKQNGKWTPATFVAHAEVVRYLEDLIATDSDIKNRPLVIFNWLEYTKWHPYSQADNLLKTLNKFRNVYAFSSKYTWETLGTIADKNSQFRLSVKDQDGSFRETKQTLGVIEYPVRRDGLAYDESQVIFPNMMHLLTPSEMVTTLEDDRVQIIAPFNSLYRSRRLQEYYFTRFFKDTTAQRVHLTDFNSANITKEIDQLATTLKGKPFVVIGLTKQDWIYMGIDIAYMAWKQVDKKGQDDFGYLGASMQAGHVAAVLAERNSGLTHKLPGKLSTLYEDMRQRIPFLNGISTGVIILCIGILLRLLLLPIGYLEAHSRFLRKDIQGFTKLKNEENLSNNYLVELEQSIAKRIGCNTTLEIIGGLLSIILVLPFYQIIIATHPFILNYDTQFLWLENITLPSASFAFLLNLVILFKIFIGRIGTYPSRVSRRDLALIPLFIAFQFLLAQVPATVLIYALGIIGFQTLVELIVRISTWRLVSQQLLQKPLNDLEKSEKTHNASRHIQSLAGCWGKQDIGNKARRLGRLSTYRSKLFSVPEGVVIPASTLDSTGKSILTLWHSRKINAKWAVRSCGLAEDSDLSSMAGFYDTKLNITDGGIDSAFREVARSFGSAKERRRSSIIIQQMVQADLSGVLFTVSPTNSELSMGEYGQGLAEKLVAGETEPGSFTIGRNSGIIQFEANSRDLEEIDYDLSKLFQRLFVVGRLIEDLFNMPQDIEWAYVAAEDQLYIIQSRDITATLHDDEISAEQKRGVLLANSANTQGDQLLWSRGALAEVVSQPSPFSASLLSRLYSGSGALGEAMRNLGYSYSKLTPSTLDNLFGELFERKQQGVNGFSLKNLLRKFYLKRCLTRDAGNQLVSSIEQRLALVEQEVTLQWLSPVNREYDENTFEILSNVLKSIDFFDQHVYPIGFEATTLAGLVIESLSKTKPQSGSPGIVAPPTRTNALYQDIALVHHEQLSKDIFISRWGHRGANEYDLAYPSFGEDVSQLANVVASLPTSTTDIGIQTTSAEQNLSMPQRLIQLKENSKDLSIKFLHGVLKPNLKRLEQRLNITPGSIHFCQIEDLETLVFELKQQGQFDLGKIISRRQALWKSFHAINLGEDVSMHVLEQLEAAKEQPAAGRSKVKGKMVSSLRSFEGPIVKIDNYNREELDALDPGFIIVTYNLTPNLVSLFSQAAGCISEKGGMLSHAAIVGRELDFPILTGIAISSPEFQESSTVLVLKDGSIQFN